MENKADPRSSTPLPNRSLLAKFMRIYAETMVMRNSREQLTEKAWTRMVDSYSLILDDIQPAALEAALVAISREPGRIYFPTPGEISGVLDKARLEQVGAAADQAWDLVQRYMAKWGCPAKAQTRVISKELVTEEPPALTGTIAAAIAAAGGYDALYHTGTEHAHFARERFTAAFRQSAEQQTRGILTPGEAKQLLVDIAGKSQKVLRGTSQTNDTKGA